ncbi:MAG: MBL fold metallo-hydrolase [Deltaproteobacteria bacterium]|nr:MAG: MBL fold metallo-hydrolase [Deltaproteobacteria bacterium]
MKTTMNTQRWLLGAVLLITSLFHVACQTAVIREEAPKGKLYSFKSDSQGFDTKNFFYDSGKEVVVFDSQFTGQYAEQSIAYIRKQTQSPIKYLVITHPNPDKFNGLQAFQAIGAKVIASKKTAAAMPGVHQYKKHYFVNITKAFTDKTYPALGTPDVTFDKEYSLELSTGESITLTELGTPGVSSNQTVAYIPSLKSYLVGDLIHHKAHAWLEGGIVNGKPLPNLKAWRSTLQTLAKQAEQTPGAVVFGGRGMNAPAQDAITQQIQYLEKAEATVETYIQGLGERKSELSGDKAGEHYKALMQAFEKAFPDYQLSYMIQYGVYGLVNAKL